MKSLDKMQNNQTDLIHYQTPQMPLIHLSLLLQMNKLFHITNLSNNPF